MSADLGQLKASRAQTDILSVIPAFVGVLAAASSAYMKESIEMSHLEEES